MHTKEAKHAARLTLRKRLRERLKEIEAKQPAKPEAPKPEALTGKAKE